MIRRSNDDQTPQERRARRKLGSSLSLAALTLTLGAILAVAFLEHEGAGVVVDGASAGRQHACTSYVTPSGRARSRGERRKRPTTLQRAGRRAVPGSVICLLRGTYDVRSEIYLERSGRPGRPIVYRSYGGRARLRWTGGRPANGESLAVFKLAHGAHDVVLAGLSIDGAGRASQGVKCNRGAHDLVVRDSSISNTGSAGVSTKKCDRVMVLRNRIYKTGYDPNVGWSSAVSLNMHVWSDHSAGFHSYVVGNVISGATDDSPEHSEGSGVIIDRGGEAPPVLVANNVVYQNGGLCINVLDVAHVWVVNNTCYQNGLDPRQTGTGELAAGRLGSHDVHFLNNVAQAAAGRPPFKLFDGATATFAANVEDGGSPSAVPSSTLADAAQVRRTSPGFAGVPRTVSRESSAVPPWSLGPSLAPAPGSPLLEEGIDPSSAAGATPALREALQRYAGRDLAGWPRRGLRQWGIGARVRAGPFRP